MDVGNADRSVYLSLSESRLRYDYTPRLFHLTSWTGAFRVEEIASLTKMPDFPCAYPFLQVCIYPLDGFLNNLGIVRLFAHEVC